MALRQESIGQGARARGGRLGAAGVGRDQRVPERALSPAVALAGRSGRACGRAAARLPLRRLLEALLRAPARGGRRPRALRGRARLPRRAACGDAMALRPRLRARRRRLPPLGAPRPRPARPVAGARAGARGVARARRREALDRRRARAGGVAVTEATLEEVTRRL